MSKIVFGIVPFKTQMVFFIMVQLLIFVSLLVLKLNHSASEKQVFKRLESNWPEAVRAAPLEYEKTRRRLRFVVEDLWYFMGTKLRNLEKLVANHSLTIEKIAEITEGGIEYKRTLLREVERLAEVDGYIEWRAKEAADLSDLVQRRLEFLQNPKDCRKARILVCSLRKPCGFGCQLHHVVYCLITAYATQRTLVLLSQGWTYNAEGWEAVFEPVSKSCKDAGIWNYASWNGINDTTRVVFLPAVDFSKGHPYLPLSVPKDLAGRISRLHESPAVWWVGQMVKYLMRLQPHTNDMITQAALNLTFKRPIVGVHIRRTDKLNKEAAFHSVEEYMSHVEEFHKQLARKQEVPKKRIYLASDDVNVFKEIRAKYPDYDVVGDPSVSAMAGGIRYCSECLNGLIVDIHLLANSDFLVCTFSSQVCRLAYELMQSLHPDASSRFRSLDDLYYFGGGGMHRVVAIMNHHATSEDQMDLKIGDVVKVFGSLWNGLSVGFNFRTERSGLFPSFKVEDVIEAVDFPYTYSQVPQSGSHRLSPQEVKYQTEFHY